MTNQIQEIEELTREAIREVFQSMVSLEMAPENPVRFAADPEGQIAGSVGFIGASTGVIYLYAGISFAKDVTSRLLGLSNSELEDEMVNDAIGELSNMVVGYVKSRLCDRGWTCTLTIPSIVRGQQLTVEGSADISRKMIGFSSEGNHLVAELLLKNSAN